jgi:hypothetical protein
MCNSQLCRRRVPTAEKEAVKLERKYTKLSMNRNLVYINELAAIRKFQPLSMLEKVGR